MHKANPIFAGLVVLAGALVAATTALGFTGPPVVTQQFRPPPDVHPQTWCGQVEGTAVDTVVEHGLRINSPHTGFPIFQLGGAVGRAGERDTAFHGRDAGHRTGHSSRSAGSMTRWANRAVSMPSTMQMPMMASVAVSNMVKPAMKRAPSADIESTLDAPETVRLRRITPEATS